MALHSKNSKVHKMATVSSTVAVRSRVQGFPRNASHGSVGAERPVSKARASSTRKKRRVKSLQSLDAVRLKTPSSADLTVTPAKGTKMRSALIRKASMRPEQVVEPDLENRQDDVSNNRATSPVARPGERARTVPQPIDVSVSSLPNSIPTPNTVCSGVHQSAALASYGPLSSIHTEHRGDGQVHPDFPDLFTPLSGLPCAQTTSATLPVPTACTPNDNGFLHGTRLMHDTSHVVPFTDPSSISNNQVISLVSFATSYLDVRHVQPSLFTQHQPNYHYTTSRNPSPSDCHCSHQIPPQRLPVQVYESQCPYPISPHTHQPVPANSPPFSVHHTNLQGIGHNNTGRIYNGTIMEGNSSAILGDSVNHGHNHNYSFYFPLPGPHR